jgi:hypothetical protein
MKTTYTYWECTSIYLNNEKMCNSKARDLKDQTWMANPNMLKSQLHINFNPNSICGNENENKHK